MSQHSKGPWVLNTSLPYPTARPVRTISAANGISLMGDPAYYPWAPDEQADWDLISAAPDLLEALKQFCNELDPTCNHNEPIPNLCRFCMAKAAISKAEGKQ